jgi:hypothetical protein
MKKAIAGAALLVLLVATPLRPALESGMRVHMLAQFPLLMLAGALLDTALPPALVRLLARWNAMGLSGLVATAAFMAVLMIPRVLDLALTDERIEAGKIAMLLFVGAAVCPSWRAAGLVVQGFFLGGLLPMMVVAGSLYRDSPLRLCNAYRLDDQQRLGSELIWIAATMAALWLVRAVVVARQEP